MAIVWGLEEISPYQEISLNLTGRASRLCAFQFKKVAGVRYHSKSAVPDMLGKGSYVFGRRVLIQFTVNK